jgi:hypothetical protein
LTTADKHAILRDLEEELALVSAESTALARREAALTQAVAGVRDLIALNGGAVPPVKQSTVAIQKNAFASLGNLEAAIAYLRLVHKPQTNREVLNALIAGGKTSNSKSFSDTLRVTLLRESYKPDGRLIWTGHKWKLREWSEK